MKKIFKNDRKKDWFLYIFILLSAFALGFVGFFHDLPLLGNSIETPSVGLSFRLFLFPNFSQPCCDTYPPLYFYFMSFLIQGVYFFGEIFGAYIDKDAFLAAALINPFIITSILRFVSLLSYSFSALLLYLIGKTVYGRFIGFLTFLTFLSSSFLLPLATLGQSEMPLLFFICLVIYFVVLGLKYQNVKYLFYASVFSSVAVSFKYNAVVVLIPLLLAAFRRRKSLGIKNFLIIIGIFILLTLIFHPFTLKILFSRYFISLLFINPFLAFKEILPSSLLNLISYFNVGHPSGNIHQNIPLWIIRNFLITEKLSGVFYIVSIITLIILNIKDYLKKKPDPVRFYFELGNILLIAILFFWISTLKAFDQEYHYLLPLYPSLIILWSGLLFRISKINFHGLKPVVFLPLCPRFARLLISLNSPGVTPGRIRSLGINIKYVRLIFLIILITYLAKGIILNINNQIKIYRQTKVTGEEKAWVIKNGIGKNIACGPSMGIFIENPKQSSIADYGSMSEKVKKTVDAYVIDKHLPQRIPIRYELSKPDWPKNLSKEEKVRAEKKSSLIGELRLSYLTVDQMKEMGVSYIFLSDGDLLKLDILSPHKKNSLMDALYLREQEAYRSIINDPDVKLIKRINQLYIYKII